MKIFLLMLFVCVSCATRTPVTDKLSKRDDRHVIKNVPVIEQDKYHCGPATLAMVMGHYGSKKSPDELAKGLFHKKLKGSTFPEMKARARQEGFMVLEINDLNDVMKEVSAGHPVIVLQNNGFRFFPRWHFSVVTGYDFDGPDVVLHDGDNEADISDMRFFERSFVLGGRRSLVLLPPDKLSATASELSHVEAAAFLEATGKQNEALIAYQTILKRWPQNFIARLGAANVLYSSGKKKEALMELRIGTEMHPASSQLWHNRAVLEGENGFRSNARMSAKRALELVDGPQKERITANLKEWL